MITGINEWSYKEFVPYLRNADHSRIPGIICSLLGFLVDPSKFGDPHPALSDFYGHI